MLQGWTPAFAGVTEKCKVYHALLSNFHESFLSAAVNYVRQDERHGGLTIRRYGRWQNPFGSARCIMKGGHFHFLFLNIAPL
jgi:hypothetical protein